MNNYSLIVVMIILGIPHFCSLIVQVTSPSMGMTCIINRVKMYEHQIRLPVNNKRNKLQNFVKEKLT